MNTLPSKDKKQIKARKRSKVKGKISTWTDR